MTNDSCLLNGVCSVDFGADVFLLKLYQSPMVASMLMRARCKNDIYSKLASFCVFHITWFLWLEFHSC